MKLKNFQILLLFGIGLAALSATPAQSGRRSGASPTTTTTTPSVSGPKTIEKKPVAQPKIQLLVGINGRNPTTTVPFYIFDTVLDNCIRRLGEAEIVFVTSAGNQMNRAAAIKAAKSETVRYVVLLDIVSDYADPDHQAKNGLNDLDIDYVVFEPEIAKIKKSGQTHQRIYQTGRGGVSLPTRNSPIYSEYALKQAAREAADRILEAFDIKAREDGW